VLEGDLIAVLSEIRPGVQKSLKRADEGQWSVYGRDRAISSYGVRKGTRFGGRGHCRVRVRLVDESSLRERSKL
jgi:hypothetical protein